MWRRAYLFFGAVCSLLIGSSAAGCGDSFTSTETTAHGGATSSTAGGAGGETTTGGTGGATLTGGGSTGDENCANGLDDDGDTLVDCEDDDCATGGYVCLPDGDGWTPVEIRRGPELPQCIGAYGTSIVTGGLGVTSAEVPTCECPACSLPVDAECGASTATFYTEANCGGTPMPTTLTPGECSGVGGGPGGSIRIKPPATLGSCGVITDEVAPSDTASFVDPSRLCGGAALGAGCGVGSACAPPASTWQCAVKAGDVPCPSPLEKVSYTTGLLDQRTCNCSCMRSGACTGTVAFAQVAECTNPSGSVPADDQCRSVPSSGSAVIYALLTATGNVSCSPHWAPDGEVIPTGPMTLCCVP